MANQTLRSLDPVDYQSIAAPVSVLSRDFSGGEASEWHCHSRAQFLHAVSGTMRVTTETHTWIVPPQRAIWIAPGVMHETVKLDDVLMRTAYVAADRNPFEPGACHMLIVTPLLRALILRLLEEPLDYRPEGAALHAAELFLLELPRLKRLAMTLPMPRDARLRRLCEALIERPGDHVPLESAAERIGASPRSLQRRFHADLGMSYGRWRQQMLLLTASAMLAGGERIGSVAARLNYRSPSAFSAMFRRTLSMSPTEFAAEG